MLILASRSPRRQALLRAVGIEFRVVIPEVEEMVPSRAPGRYAHIARRAALAKAAAVAATQPETVLGADTIVVSAGEILGKPRDEAEARRMLGQLSGGWHRVYTGVALACGGRRLLGYERTEVAFRRLSKNEIDEYVHSGEPMDKAGAYAIQGEGAALVRSVRGCFTNVIGLPVPKVLSMLKEFEGMLRASEDRRGGGRA
jgi:septum formation protein